MSDTEAQAINTLAVQEMLDLPQLYGPAGIIGPAGPPADLVASLEQLETAAVDPALLSSGETVASVETKTFTDLSALHHIVQDDLRAASQAVGDVGRELFLFDSQQYPAATASVIADARLFFAGTKPPITVVDPPPPPANGVEQYLVTDLTTGVV